MKILAIIPARSGSKGLKDKNIIDLCGHPLMYYTIKAAEDSGCFERIMVSTDSEHYAEVARKCGAEVPFLRSEEMSGDNASSWDTVREVLKCYKELGEEFDYIALMQPTSPLRNSDDIKGTVDFLSKSDAVNVVTVTEVDHPVQWCFTMSDNKSMKNLADSPYNYMRRQDLETHYRENGAIYLINAKKELDKNYNFYSDNCYGYVMPRERSVDIDTEVDLRIVEALMGAYRRTNIM